MKSCGPCTLCCEVLQVPALAKPAGRLCAHVCESGCGIYERRPDVCRDFVCGWLQWDTLDETWRPSTAGFLIRPEPSAGRLCIDVDPARPGAWRAPAYYPTIKTWSLQVRDRTGCVLVYAGERCTVVFPEEDLDIGPVGQDDELVVGYLKGADYSRPLVRRMVAGAQVGEWKGARVPRNWTAAKPA